MLRHSSVSVRLLRQRPRLIPLNVRGDEFLQSLELVLKSAQSLFQRTIIVFGHGTTSMPLRLLM
jgi:hypothetical protein